MQIDISPEWTRGRHLKLAAPEEGSHPVPRYHRLLDIIYAWENIKYKVSESVFKAYANPT